MSFLFAVFAVKLQAAGAFIIRQRAQENMHPVHDPYSTVVMQCNSGNFDTVIIAGKIQKHGGRMMRSDTSSVWNRLAASGKRIVPELDIPTQVPTIPT
ncbi:hypothetical protein [Rhizobium leguminosarum]|uniref:hypothetical protein n=1 Tax=Rhizobium leguminosarum TaxID=384 RepID=UPI0013E33C92|nr:hypothetical protein [Rhizobium leguminosarum]